MPIRCRLLILSGADCLEFGTRRPMGIDQEIPVDLHLDASYELLDAMRQDEFVSHPVPEGFSLDPVFIRGDHEEDEPYTEDIYGPLRYCNPPSFADIVLPEGEVPLNKAALAYVLALPGEWPIILYWS